MLRWLVALTLLLAAPAMALEEVNTTLNAELEAPLDLPVDEPDLSAQLGQTLGSVGAAMERAAQAIADVAMATIKGIAFVGAAVGTGAAALVQGLGSALATLGIGLGAAVTTAIAVTITATFQALGAAIAATGKAIAFLFAATWGLVSLLRPAAMPEPVFVAAASAGAAASASAGGWALWELARKYGILGAAGFSRISNDKVLDHPLRAQIFDLVKENPGIHASHIAREVGGGWGTVTHHLDKLQKAGMLTTRRVNNQKCFFEQGGQVSRQDMAVASALKGDTAAQITAFVQAHPMSSQKDVAEALGISAALASFHVKKLENLGVLEKMRQGKSTLLTTTESLRRLAASGDLPVMARQPVLA